jgi:hypothetical protein
MPIPSISPRKALRSWLKLASGVVLLILGLASSWLWWMRRETWPERQFIVGGLLNIALLAVGTALLWDVFRDFAWKRPFLRACLIGSPFLLGPFGLLALRDGERHLALTLFGFSLLPLPFVHQALGGRLFYSRLSYFALALSSLGFVVMGCAAFPEPDSESYVGWLGIGFFLPLALFFLARTVSPRFLLRWQDIEATSQGLRLTRTRGEVVTIPWAEIASVGRSRREGVESLALSFVNFEHADRTYRLYSPVQGWLARMRLLFMPYHFYLRFYEIHALGKDPETLASEAAACWRKARHT